MDTWYKCYTVKAKASTRTRYEQDIRLHIKPELGHIRLQDLTCKTGQKFMTRCKEVKGLSEKSLKIIYLVVNKALNRAQKDGLIKANPFADVEIPAYEEPKKKMRPLMDNEVPEFLRLINGHPFEEFYYVAMFTGMRESELIGLTWDCVDLDKGTIHLYRQFKALRGKSKTYTFTTLKNKQERSFSIPPSVIRALKKAKPGRLNGNFITELSIRMKKVLFLPTSSEVICVHSLSTTASRKLLRRWGCPKYVCTI